MAGYNDEDEFEDEEDLRILTMIDVDSYPQMATATSGNGPNWGRPEGQPTYKVESPRAAVDSGQHLRSRQNSGIHSTGIQQRHEMPYRGDPMQARDQWGRNAPVVATDVTFTERQIVGADFMHPPESTELQELRVRLRQAEDENQRLQVENKRMRYEKDGGLKIFEQRNLELERRIVDLQNQQRAHQTTIEKQFKEQLTYKEEEVNRLRTELLFEQKEKVNLEFDRTQVLVQTKRERGPTQHPIHSSFFEEIDMSAITENQHLPVSSQHSMEEPSNDISMDILPESILVTDENEVNSAKTGSTVTPLQRELIVEETPALLFIRHLLADTVTDVKAPVFALRTGPLLESQLIESLNRLSSAVNEESSLYPSYRKAVARLATNLRSLMVDPTLSLDVLVKDVDVLLEYSLTMKQVLLLSHISCA
ncbi:hypothetical protein BC832DRAFT_317333 [Gaertneriomyces semiglobifer]|nr:hypothetical protein BC832DRAFT_317333 [Gaertneriomyces semiglobifer]